MSLQRDFADAINAMREKRPLVHCITNYVTAGDTANMLLAAGASPIMADDPAETAEIAARADALLLNTGTLSESHITAMLAAGAAANKKGIPVVLDPVGVQLSEFRTAAVRRIFSEVKIAAVRGNASEIAFLTGCSPVGARGVDCDADYGGKLGGEVSDGKSGGEVVGGTAANDIADAARRYGCVFCVTGAVDAVTDGERRAKLLNGCAALKRVTGAGCMTTALIAAFSAVCEPFSAAVFGTAFMGICGELSELFPPCRYMGSFREGLFDNAGRNAEDISGRFRSNDG